MRFRNIFGPLLLMSAVKLTHEYTNSGDIEVKVGNEVKQT